MIGTVSTDEKAEIAGRNGCAHIIVTSREDIAKRVREITDGKGVPVVYDSVGKDTLMASLDSLQPRGTLVSNGTTLGAGGDRHHAAGRQGLDLGHAAGDGPLRHAALAHAGDGRRAVRPRAGRPASAASRSRASRWPMPPRRTARSSRARPPAPPCWCPEARRPPWTCTHSRSAPATTATCSAAARPGSPSR